MKKYLTAVLAGVAALLVGCSDIATSGENGNEIHDVVSAIENINSEIVLGDKIENIFTIEQVNARNAANGIEEEVEPNYIYFRCRTEDEDAQKWLSEKFDFLSIVPIDREIVEGGTIYRDPELSEDECPWVYLMKPIEDYNEVVEKGLIVEVIDEMYLDEEDIAILSAEGLEIPEDGYLTVDVENEASRGLWKKIKKFFTKYIANIPSGKVVVYDTIIDKPAPIKGVQVYSNQLGVIGKASTNSNGKFTIPVAYTSLGGLVQIIVRFENPNITINMPEKLTNILGAATYYAGSHRIENISSLCIELKKGSNAKYAAVMNAYNDYCDYCDKNSVTKPKSLNIWVVSGKGNSCTPLCRYAGRDMILAASGVTALFMPTVTSILALTSSLQPDIILDVKNANDSNYTEVISRNMFHELSHASHYFGLGVNGKIIWAREYADMIKGWKNSDDPFEDCYNNGGTSLVKLIESWGYFSSYYMMAWKYPVQSFKDKVNKRDYLEELKTRALDSEGNSKQYFYYSGLYNLIAEKDEKYRYTCSNYTYRQLYTALVQSGVDNANSFASSLVRTTNRNSELTQVKEILLADCKK